MFKELLRLSRYGKSRDLFEYMWNIYIRDENLLKDLVADITEWGYKKDLVDTVVRLNKAYEYVITRRYYK